LKKRHIFINCIPVLTPKVGDGKMANVKVGLKELEQYLMDAANILRGPVEHADFKTYIFPLLFFKRISDVYDGEYQQALDESGGDIEYALFEENHRFLIPEGCHWKDIRETTVNVGHALTQALRGIESANQELHGIFGDAQWTNKERFPDRLLSQLVEHFSIYNLSNSNVESDVAGQAYEYLIKRFADMSKRKAGEFYTPRAVVRLMTMILDPKAGEAIYDPACGTGGMLLEALVHVSRHSGDIRTLKLYGQEKNLTTSAIARMNLLLHGRDDFEVKRGDTLRNPAFFDMGELSTFDCVIANPPFSLKNWGLEIWQNDPYGRNFAGLPPKGYGDYAWVQHMITSMAKPYGRLAVVLPHGALFRRGAEVRIRKIILEQDILDAVIGLGPNLFYGTSLSACIMVFRARKSDDHTKKVMFIDASEVYQKGRNQSFLLDEDVNQIFEWFRNYQDVDGRVKVVTLDEIKENNYNLNIPLYVELILEEETITIEEALIDFKKAIVECFEAKDNLKAILKREGLMD
jgi:type I restriction enzyme M protein